MNNSAAHTIYTEARLLHQSAVAVEDRQGRLKRTTWHFTLSNYYLMCPLVIPNHTVYWAVYCLLGSTLTVAETAPDSCSFNSEFEHGLSLIIMSIKYTRFIHLDLMNG